MESTKIALINYLHKFGDTETGDHSEHAKLPNSLWWSGRGPVGTVKNIIPGWNKAVEKFSTEASIEDLKEVKRSLKGLMKLGTCNRYPVHKAAENGYVKLMKLFFYTDFDFNQLENVFDVAGWYVFHHACMHGRTEIVEMMINSSKELGIDLNARNHCGSGWSGFTYAIFNLNHEADTMKLMIEKRKEFGIDIRQKDEKGKTPLDTLNEIMKITTRDFTERKAILEEAYAEDKASQPTVLKFQSLKNTQEFQGLE